MKHTEESIHFLVSYYKLGHTIENHALYSLNESRKQLTSDPLLRWRPVYLLESNFPDQVHKSIDSLNMDADLYKRLKC